MNLIRLFLIVAFFSVFSFSVQAQNVKPKYKKIILVTYRPSGTGSREFIRIESYAEINENGIVHDVYNVFEDYYGDLTFKGYMGDTTYKIPDSLVTILNKVFNGSKKLKQHNINSKTDPIEHFAGPFEFLSYSTANANDNLVIVTQEFLDQELNGALDKLFRLPFASIHVQGKVYRNKSLEARILLYHKACKCAPVIEEPPTVKELIKN
jgi:hypothetical protein